MLGSLPQHGFARNSLFKVVSCDNGTAVLELVPTKEHLRLFPYLFKLTVTVRPVASALSNEGT